MQTRWREIILRFTFLSLCKLGFLLYLFTTVACEISQVCLKASRNGINRVKIPGRVLRNWNLASMDGRHVMVRWIYCNSVCLSFNIASPSLRNKPWSIEASKTIRLVWISATWTGYESIGNNERVFPAVVIIVRAHNLLMLRMEAQNILLDWQLLQKTVFRVAQELHWNQWIWDHHLRWDFNRFTINSFFFWNLLNWPDMFLQYYSWYNIL